VVQFSGSIILDSVRDSFPLGLKHIHESYYLHDATVLGLGRRGAAFILVLQLDTPPGSILTFTYYGGTKVPRSG